MPAIARFYGIVIAMFFNDHAPHTSTPATVSVEAMS